MAILSCAVVKQQAGPSSVTLFQMSLSVFMIPCLILILCGNEVVDKNVRSLHVNGCSATAYADVTFLPFVT